MRARLAVAALVALLAPAAPAHGSTSDGELARRGLARAVSAGVLAPLDAEGYRRSVAQAEAALEWLPASRAQNLRAVLGDVAAQWRRYDYPPALALFSMLDVNTRHLSRSAMPPAGHDVVDVDGVVYRSFPGRGLQFHPLGSFGKLNAAVSARRSAEALRLAYALASRAVPSRAGLVWEYYFRFAGGSAPWTSGMAQAVAAQALARSGLVEEARAAYEAIPDRLVLPLEAGPWIRLYSFSGIAVLNAQLQAAISLRQYSELADDPDAATLAADLLSTADALFPRFDTGCWSLYALDGAGALLGYHRYVVSLLAKLAAATDNRIWAERARRLRSYDRDPLVVRPAGPLPVLYPIPADGFRDAATIAFTVSKCATVTLRLADFSRTLSLRPGRHAVVWRPGFRRPGAYRGRLVASGVLGKTARAPLPPVVVSRDRKAPVVAVRLEGERIEWRAADEGTPWLRFRLLLERTGSGSVVPLGRQPLSGSARLAVACGPWQVALLASDSSGNAVRVPLGLLGEAPLPPGACELWTRLVTWEPSSGREARADGAPLR